MTFKAVLFDLDGTLLDTIDDISHLINGIFRKYGFPSHDRESYKRFIGEGIFIAIKRALAKEEAEEEIILKIAGEIAIEFPKLGIVKTKPYKGILELVDELKKRNIRMSIFSNRPDKSTQLLVKHFFKNSTFEIITGATPELPLKPDPFVAIKIAKQMNIPVNKFCYLGDSDVDMQTAIAANMHPVGVLWGFRPKEELLKNGAKTLLAKPKDLLKII